MPTILVINHRDFNNKGWRRPDSYAFAATRAVTPLVALEFAKAAAAMPIAFIQQDNRYLAVALLSPLPGRNLFVSPGGQWLGSYVPGSLRSHPFVLARAEGSEDVALCIQEGSDAIVPASDANAHPFFDQDGNATAETRAAFEFLTALERSRVVTEMAVASLADAGLMQPWPFQVTVDNEPTPVEGLYRIDERALTALADDGFLELRRTGALPLAYLQLASMAQVALFEQLSRMQVQRARPSLSQSAAAMEELFAQIDPDGKLFG